MENNDIKEIAECFKTGKDFAQDYMSYCNCREAIQNYNRNGAIVLLNKLIQRYKIEINQLGLFGDGSKVIYGINYDNIPDIQIINQLIYIGQRIPVYAFIREGNKRIAEILLEKIGCSGFIL